MPTRHLSVNQMIRKQNSKEARRQIQKTHIEDVVALLNHNRDESPQIFVLLSVSQQAEIFHSISKRTRDFLLSRLSDKVIANFLSLSDENDATDVLNNIDDLRKNTILEKLKSEKAARIASLLPFNKETAGGIMDLNYILSTELETQKSIVLKIQKHVERTNQSPTVLVVDKNGRLTGNIPLSSLIPASTTTPTKRITKPIPSVAHHMSRKQLLHRASLLRTDKIVVVDVEKHPIGIVHASDLLTIFRAQSSSSLLSFAGVQHEESVLDSPFTAVRLRYKWLILNLGTAFLAAFTVSMFEDTLSKMVILAAYMPIVAGMGGNAGTQSIAVVVRGIAIGEVQRRSAIKIVVKELIAGLVDGIIIAIIIGIVSMAMGQNPLLGLVLGLAIVSNLVIAGLAGSIIPLVLKHMNLDPALSASVFVTTATDVCGFFIFLSLAGLILL